MCGNNHRMFLPNEINFARSRSRKVSTETVRQDISLRANSFPHPGSRQRTPSAEGHSQASCERRFAGWDSLSTCNQPKYGLPDPCASPDPTSTPNAAGSANTTTGFVSPLRNHSDSCAFQMLSRNRAYPNSSGADSNISGLSDPRIRECTRPARGNLLVCRLYVTVPLLSERIAPASPLYQGEELAGRNQPRTRTLRGSQKSLSPASPQHGD